MNPEIAVTAAAAARAAQEFDLSAKIHADIPEYVALYRKHASEMSRVAQYLREEPGVVSVNYDDSAGVYWPLRIFLASEEVTA